MKKIKQFLNYLKSTLKHLHKVTKSVKRKYNNLYLYIMFDIFLSKIIFGSSIDEYEYFEFYSMNYSKRKTYITNRKFKLLNALLINKKIISILNNKEKLFIKIKSHINREITNTKKLSYKQFEDLLKTNNKIIAKNPNSSFEKTYGIYDLKDYRGSGFILEQINNNKQYLVEKYFQNHKDLRKISNNLIIIKIVTLSTKDTFNIISSTLSFKDDNGKKVNGHINIKKSTTIGNLIYENNDIYSTESYTIPYLEKVIEFIKKISYEFEEMPQIEWSICINSKGMIHLMDMNVWEDYLFTQKPEYRKNREGLVNLYKKILNKKA